MADDDPTVLDPAMTLGGDDPLRAWANQNIDWRTGRLLSQDPSKAIDSMISRGIPPPSVHADGSPALAYDDPSGAPDPTVRTNPDGSIASNVSAGSAMPIPAPVSPSPNAVGRPSVPLPQAASAVPTPKPRPPTADEENPLDPTPTPTDVSAKKKPSVADAVGDASKSFAGIKAPTPPPLNAVGTPSVRSPTAVQGPNLAQLISLTGNSVPPPVLASLAKLLVAGKT